MQSHRVPRTGGGARGCDPVLPFLRPDRTLTVTSHGDTSDTADSISSTLRRDRADKLVVRDAATKTVPPTTDCGGGCVPRRTAATEGHIAADGAREACVRRRGEATDAVAAR